MDTQRILKEHIANYLNNDTSKDYKISISKNKAIHFAETIRNAILKNKRLYVYGDFDVDGICSTVYMTSIIKDVAKFNDKRPSVDFRVPSRAEHYGIKYETFEALLASQDLIITVDNGTHKEFFSKLSEKDKKKILILDHHPNGDFQDEENVINPNTDGSISISTGIIIDAIHQSMRFIDKSYERKRDKDAYKDLAAITLISDMANANNKTVRAYIKKGLEIISERKRPLYNHFFPEWQKEVKLEDVAFNLIPKLNSVGRLGLELDWVVELFHSMKDTDFVKESVLKLEDTNEQRKEALNYYTNIVEKQIKQSGVDLQSAPLLYFHNDEVPIGLNGLIAGNISQKYKTNALFTSINFAGDEQAVGSGRGNNIKQEMIKFATKYPEVSKHIQFGGHLKAIGLRTDAPELILQKAIEYSKTHTKDFKDERKTLITQQKLSLADYMELCEGYGEICGSVPLKDSFCVTVPMLILGYDKYRNNFVKLICQDERGNMLNFITKKSSDMDLLSEEFQDFVIEIKTISDKKENVVFTDIETIDSFNNISNDIEIDKKEDIQGRVKI